VHPSLLPRWRGPDPYFWAIERGDAESGVTLHRLAAAYDTGNVIAQQSLPIAPHDNAWTLAKKLDRPSLALFVQAAQRLAAGEALEGTPQDDTAATHAPQPPEDVLALDFRQPADAVLRRVRALAPWPGALAQLGDAQVVVLRARSFDAKLPKALEPGDAVACAQGVVIRTGTGGVLIERVRDEDGNVLRGTEVQRLFPEGLFRLSPSAV
jgi:methionyl-tRNA formyltransferase